jgi:hypothetical protein
MASPTLTTLFTFDGINGAFPFAGLIADATGDLFGTTSSGGTVDDGGTVFEIPKTATGFGSLTTLVIFNGNGSGPEAGLIADDVGDLFGTTVFGSTDDEGTVFEIPKTATGFGSLTTLVSFNGSNGSGPEAGLIADDVGDLFGTTAVGGTNDVGGTVFEVPKTATGFGSLTTLVSFNGSNGSHPEAGLIADATGDLFGTTSGAGSTNDEGTVFEIPKTATGFGSVTTLVSFNGSNGSHPEAGLIADATGDLFGTTSGDGLTDGTDGTVFELTNTGFAPITPATLEHPVFRFFDNRDGGHFFTTSAAERDQVLATRKDMTFEGVGYNAVDNRDPSAAAVYRFFDTQDGGHFFTTSATERDQVLATRPDMKFEGIGYDEHATQQAGDTAVYRFFETTSGGHFFTSSAVERDQVQATRPDMHFEGTAFFAPT